jgi:hypothetical protein
VTRLQTDIAARRRKANSAEIRSSWSLDGSAFVPLDGITARSGDGASVRRPCPWVGRHCQGRRFLRGGKELNRRGPERTERAEEGLTGILNTSNRNALAPLAGVLFQPESHRRSPLRCDAPATVWQPFRLRRLAKPIGNRWHCACEHRNALQQSKTASGAMEGDGFVFLPLQPGVVVDSPHDSLRTA